MPNTRGGAPRAARSRTSKEAKTYRYDSSLSPALDWDGRNGARELGEWLLAAIDRAATLDPPHEFAQPQELKSAEGRASPAVRGLRDAVDQLKRLGKPFLDWAGKTERVDGYRSSRGSRISTL